MTSLRSFKDQFKRLMVRGGHGEPCITYNLSPEGLDQYHTERWESLPHELRQRMVAAVQQKLLPEATSQVRELHAADPLSWWSDYHHGAGTNVRNQIRESGITDDELRAYYPDDWTGYWGLDDFWVAALEVAVGVREG